MNEMMLQSNSMAVTFEGSQVPLCVKTGCYILPSFLLLLPALSFADLGSVRVQSVVERCIQKVILSVNLGKSFDICIQVVSS